MRGKDIFNDYINKSATELREHVARVVEMCIEFSENMNLNDAKKELLIDAAWLHDIAKFDNDDEHNKKKHVEAAVKQVSKEKELSAICEIIKAHKGKFKPSEEYKLEAAILRICDKLDRFNKKKEDASEKCIDSMEKINEKIPQLPKEFDDTYKSFQKKLNPKK